ncbi:uncharacterized protein ASCRUDRAFT_85452 [Ascoidea rubescens DSM 1968]|uniref:Uncharacterized protein n=1 Tax=Ascoidea rubescens DSM 1968 TaxID=1344418 RepID=A0A1D2VK21_9ASCO|nr:hypothetical protein ASCRUDRAFT_85452 [Ascoidea rubescens DSM 1968]ODV61950.1 hypothetical protein ASCRUDRAFT_85452 [Ascoidea rubescens DSM 1968]
MGFSSSGFALLTTVIAIFSSSSSGKDIKVSRKTRNILLCVFVGPFALGLLLAILRLAYDLLKEVFIFLQIKIRKFKQKRKQKRQQNIENNLSNLEDNHNHNKNFNYYLTYIFRRKSKVPNNNNDNINDDGNTNDNDNTNGKNHSYFVNFFRRRSKKENQVNQENQENNGRPMDIESLPKYDEIDFSVPSSNNYNGLQ